MGPTSGSTDGQLGYESFETANTPTMSSTTPLTYLNPHSPLPGKSQYGKSSELEQILCYKMSNYVCT
ncbi:hypothetical protein Trydic_g21704 [Trypoxylus dichotomus]